MISHTFFIPQAGDPVRYLSDDQVLAAVASWAIQQGAKFAGVRGEALVLEGTELGSPLWLYVAGGSYPSSARIAAHLEAVRQDPQARSCAHAVVLPYSPEWQAAAADTDEEVRAQLQVWFLFVGLGAAVRKEPPPAGSSAGA